MSEMIVGGSWGAVGRDCWTIADSSHDFDNEFGNVAAGGAYGRHVVRIRDAVVRVLREVHQRDSITPLTTSGTAVSVDDAAFKCLKARTQPEIHAEAPQ